MVSLRDEKVLNDVEPNAASKPAYAQSSSDTSKKRKSDAVVEQEEDTALAKKQAVASIDKGKSIESSSGEQTMNDAQKLKYGYREHINREQTPGREGPIKPEDFSCEPDIKPFKGEKGKKVRKTVWEKEEEYRQFAFENENHVFHEYVLHLRGSVPGRLSMGMADEE